MKLQIKRGFTLIELLVVVLIIGILAAVALPQYQKAVERSRMAEAMQRLGDYASAQQVYYMHNNGFAGDYAALNQGDIRVPEQTEVGAWDTDDSRWEVTSASGSNLEKVEMSAERMSGIFEGCILTLTVEANGHIEKTCQGNADCCAAAQNSGYGEATAGGDNSGNSGGNSSRAPVSTEEVTCQSDGNWEPYRCKIVTFSDNTSVLYEVVNHGIPIDVKIIEYDASGNEIRQAFYTDDSNVEGASLEQLCEDYPSLEIDTGYDWQDVHCS